ncbi:heterokaryon incompatibility protein-domain-containing protein [Podospora conica]|nr:heterokaryon incompatibility protein-domain-containing protein [Schizothecium conicum]
MEPLCQQCQAFDIQSFANDISFPWRGYRACQVQSSAANGCKFCRQIADRLQGPSREHSPWTASKAIRELVTGEEWVHFRILRSTDNLRALDGRGLGAACLVVEFPPKTSSAPLLFQLAADEGDPACTSGDVVGNYTERSTILSDSFTASIQTWLSSCAGHSKCSRVLSGGKVIDAHNVALPARCIHISRVDRDAPLSITLRNTEGNRGAYLTLTHRWTEETERTSTTRFNVANRLQGEWSDTLPRLFMDVFELAHRIGICYVWIDSLCIIQGEDGEWETEALRMADYYQHSTLTVACPAPGVDAALFAHGVTQGDSGIPLVRLPYRDKTGQQQGYFYLFRREEGLRQRFDQVVAQSELLSRGWVFQEWMLSRRIVCFTSSGLFFLCPDNPPQTQLGEAVDGGPVDRYGHVPIHFSLKSVVDFNKHNLDIRHPRGLAWKQLEYDSIQRIYSNWEAIVDSYSSLKLTRTSQDRLVALSGVAEEFGRALEETSSGDEQEILDKIWGNERLDRRTYVAGLWLSSVSRRGLLWEQVTGGVHTRIPDIPTWSWASIDTQVRWTDDRRFSFGHSKKHVRLRKPQSDIVGRVKAKNPLFSALASIDDEPPLGEACLHVLPVDRTAMSMTGTQQPQRARFPVLCLVAKMQPVILGSHFATDDDRRIASTFTDRSHQLGLENWRTVASPLDAERCIFGWASIEHPDMQCLDKLEHVFALHISTFWVKTTGGYALGYFLPNRYPVFNVLFVRRVQTVRDGFERLGVGRLFGKEMEKGKKMAVAREVRLV